MVILCSSRVTQQPTRRHRLRVRMMLCIFTSARSEKPGRSRLHLAMLSGQEVMPGANRRSLQSPAAATAPCQRPVTSATAALSAATARRTSLAVAAMAVGGCSRRLRRLPVAAVCGLPAGRAEQHRLHRRFLFWRQACGRLEMHGVHGHARIFEIPSSGAISVRLRCARECFI